MIKEVERRLQLSPETVFRTGEPLRNKLTLKVGGTAKYYAEPANLEDLRLLLRKANAAGVPVFFLGRGSNVLALDGELHLLVIRLRHPSWRRIESEGDGRLLVGAGVRLRELCGQASRLGLSGFEFLEGIPGTVGGALRMNAGAMGGSMFEVVESVRFVTMDGVEHLFPRELLQYGYRCCESLRDACAVEATVRAPRRADSAVIRETIASYQKRRNATQPKEASAGCMFKNPDGDSAGRLIDAAGLKGSVCGSAVVSEVHGNFLINQGGATSDDVIQLIRRIRKEVHRQTGVWLEPEVRMLGGSWEAFL